MNIEVLRHRIAELQTRRDSLEHEAVAHEKAAREKRAERDAVKSDLAELGKNVLEAQQLSAGQRAVAAAEQARDHAESHATELQQMRREAANILEDNRKLTDRLREQLAALAAEMVSDGDS